MSSLCLGLPGGKLARGDAFQTLIFVDIPCSFPPNATTLELQERNLCYRKGNFVCLPAWGVEPLNLDHDLSLNTDCLETLPKAPSGPSEGACAGVPVSSVLEGRLALCSWDNQAELKPWFPIPGSREIDEASPGRLFHFASSLISGPQLLPPCAS